MARVFVSYRRKQLPSVAVLVEDISTAHDVWYDQRNAETQPWWDTILAHIRQCDVVVAVYDMGFDSSYYCLKELEYAHALGKTLIPVLLPNADLVDFHPRWSHAYPGVVYRPGTRESLIAIVKQINAAPPHQLTNPLPVAPALASAEVLAVWRLISNFPQNNLEYEIQTRLTQLRDSGRTRSELTVLVEEFCSKNPSLLVGEQAKRLLNAGETQGKTGAYHHLSHRTAAPSELPKGADKPKSAGLQAAIGSTIMLSIAAGVFWSNTQLGVSKNITDPKAAVGKNKPVITAGSIAHAGAVTETSTATPAIPPKNDLSLPTMVALKGGTFKMGSDEFDDEKPIRSVTLSPFRISETEITFDQYDAYLRHSGITKDRPSDEGWGRASRPVINVTWQQAKAYADWLSSHIIPLRSMICGLPTESEWEYAARAGTETRWHWGENEQLAGEYAVFSAAGETATVTSRKPNQFKLYDMAGNVWEWVEDCYQESYQGAPSDGSAVTHANCDYRSLRGGGFSSGSHYLRAASRIRYPTKHGSSNLGFRVVCHPSEPTRD